jgi:cobalt/nickel transport system permease protein
MSGRQQAVAHLVHDGDSVVHRLPASTKIAVTVLFVLAVVATPPDAIGAFAVYFAVVFAVAAASRLPLRLLIGRLRVELPFLAFATLLPIVGRPPRTDVLGVSLSSPGLAAAWAIVVKGTLGVLAAIVLAATTPIAELLHGLRRLRVPATAVAITGFMARYLDVIAGEAGRTRIARLSRGHDPRWIWEARAVATSAGTLFVRAYERGERVHLAMLSRGYSGALPDLHRHDPPPPVALLLAAAVPVVAVATAVLAHL